MTDVEDEPLKGICFCRCDECKAKTHCGPCREFLREQEYEYQYMRKVNRLIEMEGETT